MKEIEILRRETLILSPKEQYSMPDNIADQLIKRGSGRLVGKHKPK